VGAGEAVQARKQPHSLAHQHAGRHANRHKSWIKRCFKQHCSLPDRFAAPSEPLHTSVPNAPTLQKYCPRLGPQGRCRSSQKCCSALIIIKHLCIPIFSSIRCVYACVGLSWYERARTHECSRTCPRSSTCVDISTAPSHRPNNYLIQHCPLCQVSAPSEPLCESVATP
jgi:hypothetical protein